MIRYKDLVEYIKSHHVNWDTELFCVLRDFFDQYYSQPASPTPPVDAMTRQAQIAMGYKPPVSGEYTSEDLMELFNT